MEAPEYVFSAVVLQQSFVSEKSGVMVTTDLELRERGWITVAVNEGIGGVVEGQAAESLRVELTSGEICYLAPATASHCRVLAAEGGYGRSVRPEPTPC